ncbi:MAG: hypothetical protein QG635_1309 [Bacteroidota bacterium]|nr:hypothetical protein [Bacteroidota bacterium]
MRTNLLSLFFLLLIYTAGSLYAGDNNQVITRGLPPTANYLLNNSALGTEFWIAIPQNGAIGENREMALEIQIAAIKKTEVTVEMPEVFFKSKTVEGFDVITFGKGETSYNWEVTETETALKKGLHITSVEPIAVYVNNIRQYSAEGYCAIPVNSWGSEYYHCGFYDLRETSPTYERGGGFIVIASENGTKVSITLNGVGGASGKTEGGNRKIGEKIDVTLNAGEVYNVRSAGIASAIFDLTGTHITSTKPVGMVSYHMSTMVPSLCSNGRDHLSEMVTPVSSWGKTYVSLQFDRKKTTPGDGDFFRMIGCEDGTYVHCDYYDFSTNKKIGQFDYPLNAGTFQEKDNKALDTQPPIGQNTVKSVMGISVWTSNKPFMLMQYSYSAPWDGDNSWDPSMIQISPTEQFVSASLFQTGGTGFSDNKMYLVAVGDPQDPKNELIRSVMLDDKAINEYDAQVLSNNAPGTNIYWTRVYTNMGFHKISSKTKLSGFIAGKSTYASYGWPMAPGFNKIDEPDELPPVIAKANSCGNFTVTVTEKRNGTPTGQKDQGISKIIFFSDSSENFNFALKDPDKFKPNIGVYTQIFNLTPKDSTKPSFGLFAALDRAGNYVIDSIIYVPDILQMSSSSLSFGNIRVSNSSDKTIKLNNHGLNDILVSKVNLKTASQFTIAGPKAPFTILKGDSVEFTLSYKPSTESASGNSDLDSLFIETQCNKYYAFMTGKGVLPHISVADYGFGTIKKDSLVCMEEQNENGLKIDNPGSIELTVTAIDSIKAPFSISNPNPILPFKIPAGGTVYFKSVCFLPRDTVEFTNQIIIRSDAPAADNNKLTLSGKGFKPPTGVDDEQNIEPTINISPFPIVTDEFSIGISGIGYNRTSLELFDINGNVIFNKIFNGEGNQVIEYRISAVQLSSGNYYLRMVSGKNTVIKKLLIIK